ncbi:hypothetical protein AADR41_26915 [Streptomyces sp. CLV115]|uniref:hypothetical protein n=1 Tax=Streptomyces sp. CLV115 TaxID=3138502 RepID=UPI00313B6583
MKANLLPCIQVSLSAGLLLDRTHAEDEARWPTAVARERQETRRTYAARCAVAQAQQLVEQPGPPGEHGVPEPTVHQAAVMDLTGAGDEMAPRWRNDPQGGRLSELVAGGELAADEVLGQAVDSAVPTGLPAPQEACIASDPSTAVELCLSAVLHIALAVTLTSADLVRSGTGKRPLMPIGPGYDDPEYDNYDPARHGQNTPLRQWLYEKLAATGLSHAHDLAAGQAPPPTGTTASTTRN